LPLQQPKGVQQEESTHALQSAPQACHQEPLSVQRARHQGRCCALDSPKRRVVSEQNVRRITLSVAEDVERDWKVSSSTTLQLGFNSVRHNSAAHNEAVVADTVLPVYNDGTLIK
jgi:hypothetical protein